MVDQNQLLSIQQMAEKFFGLMDFRLKVDVHAHQEDIEINLTGDDRPYLITDNGETILSLQFVIAKFVRQKFPELANVRISLDTDGYMFHHEQDLKRLAYSTAQQVLKQRRRVTLPLMNPYDRRIIHTEVSQNPDLDSVSEGDGFLKRVIVQKKFRR